MLLLYQLCRIFFYFYNRHLLGEIESGRLLYMLWGGAKFDLVGIIYTNLPFLLLVIFPMPLRWRATRLWRIITFSLFTLSNFGGLTLAYIHVVYFRFTLRPTTGILLREFRNEENLGGIFFNSMITYWKVALMYLFSLVLLFIAARLFLRRYTPRKPKKPLLLYFSHLILMLVSIPLSIAAIRGDLKVSTRPLSLNNAANYTRKPIELSLVLNTPFSIMRTLKQNALPALHYLPMDKAETIVQSIHRGSENPMGKRPNIVILILESFSRDLSGILNPDIDNGNYRGYTPFLDSLMLQSKTFKRSFANGQRSIEAMPSILASIPNLGVVYVLSHYNGNDVDALPVLLKRVGYETVFFHGAPNNSMGFSAFANLISYNHYIGKSEYDKKYPDNHDFDGWWGIKDEPFLQFFADEMDSLQEPFHTALFSLSSHHPFIVPPEHKGKFPEGKIDLDRVAGYTDYALRRFFATARTKKWFENTLFVITADHASELNNEEYKNPIEICAVPILFYYPKDTSFFQIGIDTVNLAQQIDIMPSILSLLDYPDPYIAMGNNLFDSASHNNSVHLYHGTWNILKGDYALFFDGEKTTRIHHLKTDRALQKNLLGQNIPLQDSLEQEAKAFRQIYNYRLRENKLSFSKIP